MDYALESHCAHRVRANPPKKRAPSAPATRLDGILWVWLITGIGGRRGRVLRLMSYRQDKEDAFRMYQRERFKASYFESWALNRREWFPSDWGTVPVQTIKSMLRGESK